MNIARFIVRKILETLGEDDFFSLLAYSAAAAPLVGDCRDGPPRLVQASRRNKEAAVRALYAVETGGRANLTLGLATALEMLARASGSGAKESAGCNEAVMLVTDLVGSDEAAVFEKFGNSTEPRVFSYFIDLEPWGGGAARRMACRHRGASSHVPSLTVVAGEVLKYIPVMSGPLALDGTVPPPRWSPVTTEVLEIAAGGRYGDTQRIVVALPVFSRAAEVLF